MTAAAAKHDAPDLMSRHVKPDEMPWQQLQVPGCEIKPLYFDAKTGQATLLFKMEPGATLPDHERIFRSSLRSSNAKPKTKCSDH